MDLFLKRVTDPPVEPRAGPSAAVPEGGPAVEGDDSLVCVTAPSALPGGQDMSVGASE